LDSLLDMLASVYDAKNADTLLSDALDRLAVDEKERKLSSSDTLVGSCFGAAAKVAVETLKQTGGKILMTQAHLPLIGEGKLKNRESQNLYGTDKEKTLFAPQSSFYDMYALLFSPLSLPVCWLIFSCSVA
jgi:hypothetical protein